MKYLIVKCEALNDQFECDANRTPICLTDDKSKYGYGFEIYELQENNTFKLIKEYETSNSYGIAIYDYTDEEKNPIVFEKFEQLDRDDITKSQVKKWKEKYGFTDSVKDIMRELRCCGQYGECIGSDEKFIVIGEYMDNVYSLGY